MSYKIAIDSCGELLDEWKNDGRIESIPLTLTVGGENIIDDETFDQADFLKKVAASYNSAVLGRNLLEEEKPGRKIHIFNSKSASIGQTLIGMKIQECEEAGYSFEKVIETVDEYIAGQHTFFVLDNLETLRKNGRLSKVKALVASALKIKPVMGSTDEGNICQLDQARGINKALVKMAGQIAEKTQNSEEKVLAISHCNCHERAILLKNALQEKMPLKNIVVLDTAGVSSMYANDGGVIVAV